MSVFKIQNGLVSALLFGLAAFLSGCALPESRLWLSCNHPGSGAMKTVVRNFSDYSQIRLGYDISAHVAVGDTASFSIDICENVAEYLDMQVEAGVLSLTFNTPGVCNTKAKATITVTEPLQGAFLDGSGSLNVDLLNGFVKSVASGSVNIGKLNGTSALIQSFGSGGVTAGLIEAAQSAEVTISGSGSVSLDSMNARSISIHSTGSGDFEVHSGRASQSVDVSISGSGSVSLSSLETPAASMKLMGSGSVNGMVSNNLDFQISGSGGIRTTVKGAASGSCSGSGSARIAGGATQTNLGISWHSCFARRLIAV